MIFNLNDYQIFNQIRIFIKILLSGPRSGRPTLPRSSVPPRIDSPSKFGKFWNFGRLASNPPLDSRGPNTRNKRRRNARKKTFLIISDFKLWNCVYGLKFKILAVFKFRILFSWKFSENTKITVHSIVQWLSSKPKLSLN